MVYPYNSWATKRHEALSTYYDVDEHQIKRAKAEKPDRKGHAHAV